MHRHVYIELSIIVLVLAISGCHLVSLTSHENISGSMTTAPPSLYSMALPTESAQDYPNASQFATTLASFQRRRLHCFTYIETQWGTAPGEFGFCPLSSHLRGPYPPVFNAQGDLFILDIANQRIERYSGNKSSQVIPLPSVYGDGCSSGWSNIAVSWDRLFLTYSVLHRGRVVDHLAVLSLSGQERGVIDLEPYYPLRPLYVDSLLPDQKGGVYLLLLPPAIVHFDEQLRPWFIYRSLEAGLNEVLVIGWDGNIYTYNKDGVLSNWGADRRCLELCESPIEVKRISAAVQHTSLTNVRLLGIDVEGRAYFAAWVHKSGHDEEILIRLSDNQLPVIAVGKFPDRLAPDGALYDIQYDPGNPLIRPRIIKCVLED